VRRRLGKLAYSPKGRTPLSLVSGTSTLICRAVPLIFSRLARILSRDGEQIRDAWEVPRRSKVIGGRHQATSKCHCQTRSPTGTRGRQRSWDLSSRPPVLYDRATCYPLQRVATQHTRNLRGISSPQVSRFAAFLQASILRGSSTPQTRLGIVN